MLSIVIGAAGITVAVLMCYSVGYVLSYGIKWENCHDPVQCVVDGFHAIAFILIVVTCLFIAGEVVRSIF